MYNLRSVLHEINEHIVMKHTYFHNKKDFKTPKCNCFIKLLGFLCQHLEVEASDRY